MYFPSRLDGLRPSPQAKKKKKKKKRKIAIRAGNRSSEE
jgi:hypothetical protein